MRKVPESSGKAHFAIVCWIASPDKNEFIRPPPELTWRLAEVNHQARCSET
jgi:hypothetical protein